jgi:hypothetical protein
MKLRSFFAVIVVLVVPAGVSAAVLIQHNGNTNPTTENFGLWPYNGGISTSALASDLGQPAWQISNTGGAAQAVYGQLGGTGPWFPGGSGLTAAQISDIDSEGFILSLRARIVSGPTYNASGTQHAAVMATVAGAFNNRFDIQLGSDGAGNTLVILPNSVTDSSDGTSTSSTNYAGAPLVISGTAYHFYQLIYNPTSQTSTLLVDGQVTEKGYAGASIVGGGTTTSNYGLVFGSINFATANFAQAKLATIQPGDFNFDGHVDAADILPMEQALVDLPGYQLKYNLATNQLTKIGDLNGDGVFNNADLQSLLNLLKSGGGSNNSVPEPSTLLLGVLAALMVGGLRLRPVQFTDANPAQTYRLQRVAFRAEVQPMADAWLRPGI